MTAETMVIGPPMRRLNRFPPKAVKGEIDQAFSKPAIIAGRWRLHPVHSEP
jgi:hypothetical protein